MRLGLQKTSLIDYPGLVACVVFLPGCDLACPFCHNPDMARPGPDVAEGLLDEEDLKGFLHKRKNVLGGLVISGGEPCIHPEAAAILSLARSLGYLVKLDTNGMHPEALAGLDADYAALDLKTAPRRYATSIPGARPDACERWMSSLEILRQRGKPYELRSTLAPGFLEVEDVEEIGRILRPEETWILQRFRPGLTLDPAWSGLPGTSKQEAEGLLDRARKIHPNTRLR